MKNFRIIVLLTIFNIHPKGLYQSTGEIYAKNYINNEDSLIIINCDQIIWDFNPDYINSFVKVTEADGFLGCFISSSKKNSYIKVDPNGEVLEVKEKIVGIIEGNSVPLYRPMVGAQFLKFCGKYDLKKISESPQQYVDCLSGQYPAVEQTASVLRNTK